MTFFGFGEFPGNPFSLSSISERHHQTFWKAPELFPLTSEIFYPQTFTPLLGNCPVLKRYVHMHSAIARVLFTESFSLWPQCLLFLLFECRPAAAVNPWLSRSSCFALYLLWSYINLTWLDSTRTYMQHDPVAALACHAILKNCQKTAPCTILEMLNIRLVVHLSATAATTFWM